MISSFSSDVFAKNTNLRKLFLSSNQLETIPRRAFYNIYDHQGDNVQCTTCDTTIMLSDNPIKTIEPEAFKVDTVFTRIYLIRTKLKLLSLEFFSGLGGLDSRMLITDRTITTLKYSYRGQARCTVYLNPQNSKEEAVTVDDEDGIWGKVLVPVLLASGFRKTAANASMSFFLPCPLGTFTNSTSNGKQVCTACPPGGFFSDEVGYVGPSCKKCPNGSFVHFEKAPGTQSQDCKACPRGTETDFFAGYRACQCLEGFYRTHMFGQCYKCIGGLQCTADYASLKPGYWWKWRSKTHRRRYTVFINNLNASLPALGADDVQYPYSIPTSYRCPREESCLGGLDSPCEVGYEGPLCAVCSSGYYKQLKTCKLCPSKKWIVGQLSIVAASLLIIIAVLAWTSKRNTKKDDNRSVIDMLLSKVKIVIGFYQVTYGLLETFSYIKWPGSLEVIGKYSEVLQMNVLQIAPIHCLYDGVQVDAFGNLFVMLAMNAAVIGISGVVYGISKMVIVQNQSLDDGEKSAKLSQTKVLVYRYVFFFLYTTYLGTCSMTANVLPLSCRKLCQDDKEESCRKYLKADYSIQCQSSAYNHSVIVAYISTAYVIAIPVASFIALWRHRRMILAKANAESSQNPGSSMEIITGLRFLFENYKPRSWYWELVEMSRKVILTSGLILIGEESRSYTGLTLVIGGMYGMVFSWMKPIQDGFENVMMSTSLAVTVFNLAIGAVSRIPAENISSSSEPNMETFLFNMLVLGANTLVIGLLAFQYLVSVYRYFKEWRKTPHWSFSCCLALLLPLNDLQGEMSGFAETDVLESQIKSGEMGMSTILIAMEDSRVVEESRKEQEENVKQSNYDAMAIQECKFQDTVFNKKCNQGTQTKLSKYSLILRRELILKSYPSRGHQM
ncbi:cysteine repeat modular protein A-like [Oculina patagonica]